MAEKWLTICRDCTTVVRGKEYECCGCGSTQIRQINIGPLFPEDIAALVTLIEPEEPEPLEISPEQQRIKDNEGRK